MSVLRRLGEERHGLEVAQVIEPVGAPEDVVRDVSRAALEVLEVLSRLEEQHEEEPVHHENAFLGERSGRNAPRFPVPRSPQYRIAEVFNRLAHRIAQRLGDAEGVLVRIGVELVRQRLRS